MKRLGIDDNAAGHGLLHDHLSEVGSSAGNVTKTFTNEFGVFEVKESLMAGPSGKFANFETTWHVDANGCRTLATVIPKGGPAGGGRDVMPGGRKF